MVSQATLIATLAGLYSFFMNHPRILLGIILFIILVSIVIYFTFIRKQKSSISSMIKGLMGDEHGYKIDELSSNRVTKDDESMIAGLDSQLERITREIVFPRYLEPQLKKDINLRDVRGVILYGPPGTGKTMLARNLAKKIGCTSVSKISAVSILDKFYGASEEHLRELFVHEPGKLHMVILDEIDSICPTRTSGQNDSKFYTALTNQLLSLMDGVDADPDVIVVGTTNNLKSIDPAILRPGRFDVHLEIKNPDENSRSEIFGVYTKHLIEKGRMERLDIELIAKMTEGFTGADIENVVRKATTDALYRHKINFEPFLITEEDIMNAIENK